MTHCLVLDQGYQPHRVVSWQRAVEMFFMGKVEVLEEYDEDIRSVSITIKMPAVVRLLHRGCRRRSIKFSRANLAARDNFACCYCGTKLTLKKLTYDHVIPRSQGGQTRWENIVASCYPCNERKADRTPEQARMRLRKQPEKPTWLPVVALQVDFKLTIPEWGNWVYNQLSA